MKLVVLAAALITSGAVSAGAARDQAAFVKAAKAAVEAQLRDPGSVQYRNLQVAQHADGPMLCGELNAKNGYGGYTGYRQFISSTGSMVYLGDQIEALWPEYCANAKATR